MFIDIHVHTRKVPGPQRNGKQPYATPEQLLERYDKLGIEQAVLLPGGSPECAHQPQSIDEILEICEKYPGRFIPFMNVDPRSIGNHWEADLGIIISHYKKLGCKGIGEVTANLWFLDPLVQNLFKHAEQYELPLTFHIGHKPGGCYGLIDNPGLGQLEESLKRFPKLKFFGHSQAFWAEMAPLKHHSDREGYPDYPIEEEGAVPKLFRKYPNLYGDLSAGSGCNALKRDPAYAVKFLTEFQDRLFFGTDICVPDTPTPLVDFLLELRESGKLPDAIFDKIAKSNAVRVLNLK
jgi:predicted TIM-barrel fold metal-dependent hydrolase